jgi:catechol 2,3-dioxygenase-like lactoylglutathione lyase family enzyme
LSTLVQVALCTSDMPRTIRTFVEVVGLDSAGGRPRWGERAARLQELGTGDDSYVMLWWLIGRQGFGGQVELFTHTSPPQRPRAAGWRPSDLGWTRFGLLVPDFDAVLDRLGAAGIETLTEPLGDGGRRRVCFRERGSDVVVELMEEDPAIPAAEAGTGDPRPALAYVAASVSDLDAFRRQLAGPAQLRELAPDTLHGPEHEALWGLADARRRVAVFDGGGVLLEAVVYDDPQPRPPAADALLSDQGLMNIAIGYRERSTLARHVEAAEAAGATKSVPVPESSGSTYLRLDDRLSVEMLLVPPGLDEHFGYVPQDLAPPGNAFATRREGRGGPS